MIKAVIFDLGGVVLTNDWHIDGMQKDFEKAFHINSVDMEIAWRSMHHEFFTGKITENAFWKKFFQITKTKTNDINLAKELWRKNQHIIKGMPDILEKIKKTCRLVALTNISREWLEWKKRKFHLDEYFETIISSGYTGYVKPQKEIFDILFTTIKEDPRQCLFIDDLESNLENSGANTILFKSRENLLLELAKLRVYAV